MAQIDQLRQAIEQGEYDETFLKLYGEGQQALQRKRYLNALAQFEIQFGTHRQVHLYSAPGRTEIGGNHTDHNNGVVMAAAVNLDIIAVVSANDRSRVQLKSDGFAQVFQVDLNVLQPQKAEEGSSTGLIRGVAAGIVRGGGQIGGFDGYIASDVLQGSGLSSSAAFEVVLGQIFNGEFNQEQFSMVELAKIGQYSENVFFGKPSGLMDQTACAVGSAMTIDFADPTAPIVDKVAFDLEGYGYALCITDTKGSHADLTPDYAAIRREMEAVAQFFGKKVLREVDEDQLIANIPAVRQKLGDRAVLRALHFFAECRRAEQLCQAVRENRIKDFLQMILEGGHSSFELNQNAYSLQNPRQQGVPLGLAISQHVLQGRGAWRLQGGGFAGTIQAFVPMNLVDRYKAAMDGAFGQGSCHVLRVRNYGAVAVIPNL